MKATKGNKVYTIDETQKESYAAQGYDIADDDGNIIKYGAGKSVSYEKYKELEDKNIELEKEIKKLKKSAKTDGENEKGA
ncbi:hypothetical protein [Clostridium sp. UBA1353]|uniref:hypothetical protein n=1 Tax=Clostridium sp. UBA1353 TaxID=1946347 RepID=UPI00321705CA